MNSRIVIGLLLVSLLLAGCGSVGGRRGNVPTIDIPVVHTGGDGVRIQFLQDMPPNNVLEHQDFLIGVQLHNVGAHDIQQGTYVLGYERPHVQVDEEFGEFQLPGKALGLETGEQQRLTFTAKALQLGSVTETYTTTLTFTGCYDYETEADLTTCLDADPLNGPQQEVCQMGAQSFAGGQGGPIGISQLVPRYLGEGKGFEFTFTLRNTGRGQVLLPENSFEACDAGGISSSGLSRVRFSAEAGLAPLLCGSEREPEATVRLQSGSATVRCFLPAEAIVQNTAYTAPLRVRVRYGYTETISRPVRITKE